MLYLSVNKKYNKTLQKFELTIRILFRKLKIKKKIENNLTNLNTLKFIIICILFYVLSIYELYI